MKKIIFIALLLLGISASAPKASAYMVEFTGIASVSYPAPDQMIVSCLGVQGFCAGVGIEGGRTFVDVNMGMEIHRVYLNALPVIEEHSPDHVVINGHLE